MSAVVAAANRFAVALVAVAGSVSASACLPLLSYPPSIFEGRVAVGGHNLLQFRNV